MWVFKHNVHFHLEVGRDQWQIVKWKESKRVWHVCKEVSMVMTIPCFAPKPRRLDGTTYIRCRLCCSEVLFVRLYPSFKSHLFLLASSLVGCSTFNLTINGKAESKDVSNLCSSLFLPNCRRLEGRISYHRRVLQSNVNSPLRLECASGTVIPML